MTRDEIVNQASKYIKTTAYDNPNQFTKWFWKDNNKHAWCGAFVDYVVKHDLGCTWLDSCSNFGGCGSIVDWAKKIGYWNTDYKKAKKGDLVMYGWNINNPNNYSHIGIVDEVTSSGIKSVEGNTSYGNYKENCVARKSRDKKYIKGVILLPYKEEEMFKAGEYVYAKEDIKLYTTIEYKESNYTLKKNEKAYIRLIKGNNLALANPTTHEYFVSAWTNQQNKLTKDAPTEDYKKMYEEEVAKNEVLQNQVKVLQNKINKAIEDLK